MSRDLKKEAVRAALNQQKTPIAKGLGYLVNSARKLKEVRTFTARKFLTVLFVPIILVGGVMYVYDLSRPNKQSAVKEEVTTTLPGWWIQKYFGKSTCDKEACVPDADPDKDGLSNQQEFYYHSDPLNDHTVKDSMNDGELVAAGFDPSRGGRVTFEDAISDESIFGEGILYDQDIKDMIAQGQDISKVVVPMVDDSEINSIYVDTPEADKEYLADLEALSEKYFPAANTPDLEEVLKMGGDNPGINQIVSNSQLMSKELKTVRVPLKFINFHKYSIAFYQLLGEVLNSPPANDYANMLDPQADEWFDKVQAFMAVQQKLSFEKQLINKQFNQ